MSLTVNISNIALHLCDAFMCSGDYWEPALCFQTKFSLPSCLRAVASMEVAYLFWALKIEEPQSFSERTE